MAWATRYFLTGLTGLLAMAAMIGPSCAPASAQSTANASASIPAANGAEKLFWMVPQFAPAFITDNGEIHGYAADIQNWFVNRLNDYDHVIVQAPLARLLAEIQDSGDQLRCSTTLIPTEERKSYIAFAKPLLLHLPISVVIRAEDRAMFAPFMDNEDHIRLDALLARPDLATAMRIGRSYGPVVDGHLARNHNAGNIMNVAEDLRLIKLLDLGRIDWALYFPSEAEYYRRLQTPEQNILSLPIAGNSPLLEATIGCTKSAAGSRAIERINRLVAANPDYPWTNYYADWLAPQDRERFVTARTEYLRQKQYDR